MGRHKLAVAGCLIGAAIAVGSTVLPQGPSPTSWFTDVCEVQRERTLAAAAAPFGEEARALAKEALEIKAKASPDHPYLAYKKEIVTRLEKLGLLVASKDHVHISDVDLEHGGAVIRSALALSPLVSTVTSTLSVDDVAEEFARANLRPEQYVRLAPLLWEKVDGAEQPEDLTFEQLMQESFTLYEHSILEKKLRLALLREHRDDVPPDARIFVNMSYGTSPERIAQGLVGAIMAAKPGTPLHELAKRTLGEAPLPLPAEMGDEPSGCGGHSRPLRPKLPTKKGSEPPPEVKAFIAQAERLKRDLIHPQLKAALDRPEAKRIIKLALADLEAEVAAGRKVGILVFEAAGNEHGDAKGSGDPKFSESTTVRVKGMLLVGAIDQGNPHDLRDDRVAEFSSEGNIAFSTRGVDLPVWLQGRRIVDSDGTSFSSPIAVEIATAAGSATPNATLDRLERLLKDKRVALDIPGTTRDGAGVLDPFAAVVLAANPKLTRAQIDEAWRQLGDPKADVMAIRRSLNLPPIRP